MGLDEESRDLSNKMFLQVLLPPPLTPHSKLYALDQ